MENAKAKMNDILGNILEPLKVQEDGKLTFAPEVNKIVAEFWIDSEGNLNEWGNGVKITAYITPGGIMRCSGPSGVFDYPISDTR